jgi:amidophosphoribosyltransferase
MFDSIHEECGVFGVYDASGESDVVRSTYYALYALQHRGQESCGIAVNDDGVITLHKDLGLVPEVFNHKVLDSLGGGTMALGHVRYSTTGTTLAVNSQPLLVHHVKGSMALAHNGNLTNSAELREMLELDGAIFHTSNDTEVISYMITRARLKEASIEKAVESAMKQLKGAYSMVIMSPQKLIAARDPHGFRPLCMGKRGDAIIFASETCAFSAIGAEFIRDIEPGEIVVVGPEGISSIKTHCGGKCNLCVFEFVYFARPDSVVEGVSVHEARKKAGAILARDYPVEADVVIGVPDSGLDAALGYAEASGIPYGVGFIKNRYIGRTFIQPTQGQREDSVRIKLSVLKSTVAGKRVVMVDDSIVRGTTCRRIVHLLREAGAKEVHLRISAPPFTNPCYFGTDIDSRDKLIACQMTIPEIRKSVDADSLGYLSVGGVKSIAEESGCDFCVGCFTGTYPVAPPEHDIGKYRFETKISEGKKA